jgi:hypothetical protein
MDPHNLDAERAIMGALLDTPSLLDGMPLGSEHFHPRHQPLLLALRSALAEHGPTADAVQVARELSKRDKLTAVGGAVYLAECVERRALPANLAWYVQEVEAATLRRTIHEIGARLVQQSESHMDADGLLDAIARTAVDLGHMADRGVTSEPPIVGLSELAAFVAEVDEPYRWVIPGILEYQDRCVITAAEGLGKSVLALQLAITTAAGRHPFLPRYRIPPKRTLLVDLENPPTLVRRNLRGMLSRMSGQGVDMEDRCWRWSEPGGIDVRTAVGYRQLERVLDKVNPDLVCIGPVYKMSTGHGDKYEVEAAEVQQAVDRLRQKYGCAFFMEHHAAKGSAGQERSGEPFGSSYWLRWPEFGLVLRRDRDAEENVYALGRFRGDRDQRAWPTHLVKGAHPLVPWGAMWDDLEVEHQLANVCEEAFR